VDGVHVRTVKDTDERFTIKVKLETSFRPRGRVRGKVGEINASFNTV
jgi:hypothetical protein